MNAERLLALYERVAEAPDAITRLRRFILDLAVRGKLVPQDPNDEPASELLKRITKEKARLDRKERVRREPRSLDAEAEPMQIPQGWALAPLADLVTVLNGRAYKQNELLSAGTPVLRVGNLFSSDKWYYSTLQLDEEKYCKKGDLIFAWSASFGPFIWNGDRVIYHYHIWKLPLHSEADLNKLFLYNFLLQKTREIKEAGHGISMIHMTKEKMEKLLVPIPPLAEQHRIVAKVDELMALCDRLEAARKDREAKRDRLSAASLARLNTPDPETFTADARFTLEALPALTTRPNQIKQLRQTILNLAVRGKLVPQDPNDEPASELLKRITKAKAEQKKKTGDARIKIEPDPMPGELDMQLPLGWAVQSFENLFLFIDYRGNTPPKTDDGIPLITAKNIRMGHLNREPREYISKATFKTWMTRGFPEIGDLFFTTEAPLANICLNDIEEPFALAQRVICFQPFAKIDTKFLMFALMSDVMQSLIDKHATGMTAKGIKAANLKPRPIPIPPLAEQHRIVAKVDELMALCDRLEASLTTSDQTRTRLLEATLTEALAPASISEMEAAE